MKWNSVPGYEGLYSVSSCGQVKRDSTGKTLKPFDGGVGRLRVSLSKDGKVKNFRIHQLVALAFIGECPPGYEVCHGDGNPANNSVDNLRYDIHKGNALDMVAHGRTQASKTHCVHGHEFTEENTAVYGNQRVCVACRTRRNGERYFEQE